MSTLKYKKEMFTISSSDIARLPDDALRELIVRLCEAELRERKLPISAISAGGHQDAPDGGIDVRVSLGDDTGTLDFIPKSNTGFQVKVPDMPPAAIKNEMAPRGVLRDSIIDLIKSDGAYVIVSSGANVADQTLRLRLDTMQATVTDWSSTATLTTKFYDRTQIAHWVQQYPGVVLWVRSKLGIPLQGWQPYASWSAPAEPLDAPYFFDGNVVCLGQAEKLTAAEALSHIRSCLSQPRTAVRLVGLSGVGKTRFVQALFDSRVGEHSLSPSMAVYTDVGSEPEPRPQAVLEHLIKSGLPAVVIVDNCSPEQHRTLVGICSVANNTAVSLITVEYDVSSDEPEGTEVISLRAASKDVIVDLIQSRFSTISSVDRLRIAEFSSGNSRIALALCRSLMAYGNFTSFSDAELLRRLFIQRNSEDDTLWKVAEACALVYSFDGETTGGESAEWPLLAQLAGVSLQDFHRGVQKLIDRELIQCRGKWRALLPHALSNRLAEKALTNFLLPEIKDVFEHKVPTRMLVSFARRLGYLQSSTAKRIALALLADGGLLTRSYPYSESGWALITKISPIVQAEVLALIEKELGSGNINISAEYDSQRYAVQSLLLLLAYDEALFPKAARLLVNFALPVDHRTSQDDTDSLPKLFQPYLSGTHAPIRMRLAVVSELLRSGESPKEILACQCLNSMLERDRLYGVGELEFGAMSRDYGYWPSSKDELTDWYRETLRFILEQLDRKARFYQRLCTVVARHFRPLLSRYDLMDEFEAIADAIHSQGFWKEGWRESARIFLLDREQLDERTFQRIQALEKKLAPASLIDKARAYAFGFIHDIPEYDLMLAGGGQRFTQTSQVICQKIQDIGTECAKNSEALNVLLLELLSLPEGNNQYSFGVGLAIGVEERQNLWNLIVQKIAEIPQDKQSIGLVVGFLAQVQQDFPEDAAAFLDKAMIHPAFTAHFPQLQCRVGIDDKGVERLRTYVDSGKADALQFWGIGYAQRTIAEERLIPLFESIARKKNGSCVVVDALHFIVDSSGNLPESLMRFSREVILNMPDSDITKIRNYGYGMAEVIKKCFDAESHDDAQKLCAKLAALIFSNRLHAHAIKFPIDCLFEMYPEESLAAFVEKGVTEDPSRYVRWDIDQLWPDKPNPVDKLPSEVLLAWARQNPEVRFPALASAITHFEPDAEGQSRYSEKALALLQHAPNLSDILGCFSRKLRPTGGFTGPYSNLLKARMKAVERLKVLQMDEVTSWANQTIEFFDDAIKRSDETEREREERFE